MNQRTTKQSLRLVGLLCAFTLILFVGKGTKAAASDGGSCGSQMTWTFDETSGKVTIEGKGEMTSSPWNSLYKSQIKSLEIKNGVTKVKSYAFEDCINLETVSLPDSIVELGMMSFYNCNSLSTITLPANIKHLGGSSFARCKKLKKVTIPKNVESGISSFENSGVEEVTFENGMVSIPNYLMESAHQLTKINFPSSIQEIGMMSFYNCSNLSTVNLPANLKRLGGSSFASCKKIKKVTIPKTVKSGNSSFGNSGVEEVTFENGMVSVPSYIMESVHQLTKINFPSSIREIGLMSFYNCSNLSTVNLPANLKILGGSSFASCPKIKKITIPKTVESGNSSFGNSGLEEVTFTYGIRKIPSYIMDNAKQLTKVNIPSTVQEIGMMSFYQCKALKEIVIPASVTKIGGSCFTGCDSLKTIYGAYKSTAASYAAEAKLKFVTKWKQMKYLSISGITTKSHTGKQIMQKLTVKDGSKTLVANKDYTVSYKNNINLGTATVTITGKGGYYIGSVSKTFRIVPAKNKTYNVGNLKYKITDAKVNGKGTVSVMGLTKKSSSVTISNTVKISGITYKVTSINTKAFYKKTTLKKVTIKATGIKSIGKDAFNKIYKKAIITVPKKNLKSYTKMIQKSGVAKTVKIKK